MKLLMTASTWSHIQNFHLPYLREFQRLGWETHVGCRDIPADAPYIDTAIELPFEKKMQSLQNFRTASLLRKRITAERYDLIITHTSLAAFFTRLAVKMSKRQVKTIHVAHGYLFDDDTPALKRTVLLDAERFVAPQTDLLLTMTEWDDRTAKKYRLGRRIAKIPGIGVDFSRLDGATKADGTALRKQHGIPDNAFVLLYAADFSKRKSQHVLIEAMPKLPEKVVLILCGDGVLFEECKALADRIGVTGRVLFPGRVTDMAPWFHAADVSVTASRSEGLPFNVMESMYMGLPVVASAVKGHCDLIDDGKTGLLYPYGDANACAACVNKLMGSAALREQVRARAKERLARYELGAVLPEVMGQYLSL